MIRKWTEEIKRNLYGNPHSDSSPSKEASGRVDWTRDRALRFFGADPEKFDLIFVANATAAVRLVTECFRDYASREEKRFWYAYHADAHTSLVGSRELSDEHRCFSNDDQVGTWIHKGDLDSRGPPRLGLFAYPGQSNFNGRRLPLNWWVATCLRNCCFASFPKMLYNTDDS